MKKIIFSLSALAALFLAGSCQRENLEPVEQGGTVTYTVQVPGALATKTDGEGFIAHYEVYRQGDVETPDALPVYEGSQPFENGSANIELEFVKNQKFVVLFWAQKEGAKVYDIEDLRKVSISKAQKLTSNNFDAEVFAGNDLVENCASKKGGNVVLVRPVAQLNIATDAEGLHLGTTPVELQKSYVKVTGLSATYNVYEGYGSTETANAAYGMTAVPNGTVTVGTKPYTYVAMNYIGFMPQSDITVDVDFTIQTSEGNINHTVSNVPVKPNYKTNIIGNLITATDNYQVTLGAWGTEETNVEVVAVSTAQDLQEAIENIQTGAEGNIILEGNIDLGALFGASTLSVTKAGNTQLPIVIDENKAMTLDLNGFTITTPWESETDGKHYYAFENHGSLNIVDSKENGKIVARGNFNYGKMTLESGTIEACDGNGGYGVRNYEGAEFVMNGGSIVTSNEDDNQVDKGGYDATTLRVDEGATAIINGGTINNICDFTFALDNYGTTTVKGGEFTSIHTTAANNGTLTIDGGSFTINGLEGITAHALWAAAGTTTINGGTFDGKDNYNGFNVDASDGATVYIKGGEFLPVHSGSLYGDGTIIVTGGTFFDEVPVKYLAAGYSCQQNEEGKWIVPQVALAKIGEVSYPTLAAAIDAVSEDAPATITVQAAIFTDEPIVIPAGKSITLDLNGMSITGPKGGAYAITNNGILTIDDSQKVGVINGVVYGGPEAQTVIDGGTYNAHVGEKYVFLNNAGSLTINNATINGGTSYPVYSYNEGNSLVINNVVINATFGCVNAYGLDCTVEINGGTFKMTGVQGKTSHIAYFSSKCTANINGGTFEKIGNISMSATGGGGICVNGGAGLTINGGSFAGDYDDVYNYGGSIIVKGGTYKFKPDFLAEGYEAVQNTETGKWEVVKVQANNEIWYVSDEMALEPTNPDAINATVVSNVWDKTTGKGVITFDAPLKAIGEKAFQRVTNATPSNWATSISLPEGVETIGNYAFAQCYSLTTITIPNTVTAIGQYAFQSCDAVTSVTIGSGVANIGSGAFYNCYEIKEIVCKSITPPALADKWVFSGVNKAAKVIVPAGSVDEYKADAFWSSFTNIVAE